MNKLKIDKETLERENDELRRQIISSQESCKVLTEKLKQKRKKQLEKSQRSQDELVSAKYDNNNYDNNNHMVFIHTEISIIQRGNVWCQK